MDERAAPNNSHDQPEENKEEVSDVLGDMINLIMRAEEEYARRIGMRVEQPIRDASDAPMLEIKSSQSSQSEDSERVEPVQIVPEEKQPSMQLISTVHDDENVYWVPNDPAILNIINTIRLLFHDVNLFIYNNGMFFTRLQDIVLNFGILDERQRACIFRCITDELQAIRELEDVRDAEIDDAVCMRFNTLIHAIDWHNMRLQGVQPRQPDQPNEPNPIQPAIVPQPNPIQPAIVLQPRQPNQLNEPNQLNQPNPIQPAIVLQPNQPRLQIRANAQVRPQHRMGRVQIVEPHRQLRMGALVNPPVRNFRQHDADDRDIIEEFGIPANQDIKDEEAKPIILACTICHTNLVQTVNFPCMHALYCGGCARPSFHVAHNCSLCRTPIAHIARLYLQPQVLPEKRKLDEDQDAKNQASSADRTEKKVKSGSSAE